MKGQHLYSELLLLYPKPFRVRFGGEMMRLFRDCYPATGAAAFWLETLRDLAISVPREWRREISREDSAIDYTGFADAVICSIVVGALLLGWGWTAATFARDLGIIGGKSIFLVPKAEVLFTIVALATAFLVGVLSTLAAARGGRIDTASSQFIRYNGNSPRLSR